MLMSASLVALAARGPLSNPCDRPRLPLASDPVPTSLLDVGIATSGVPGTVSERVR